MPDKDLLRLDDLSAADIERLTERAIALSRQWTSREVEQTLAGYRIALIVDEGGWRNTTALEHGATALGALCTQVPVSLSGKEDLRDLARYLENWFDLIAIRTPSLESMRRLAEVTALPVLNLRTKDNHPCETLGDLCFIRERRGSLQGLVIVAVAPAANILNSWAEAAMVMPIALHQVYPSANWLDSDLWDSPNIERSEHLTERLASADVVVTDCWPDGIDPVVMAPYRITAERLDQTPDDCLFIPCPPVTRGEEVTDGALYHDRFAGYDAKAFLLHGQNAVLEFLLSRN